MAMGDAEINTAKRMGELDDGPVDGTGESPTLLALKAQLAELQAENAKLKARTSSGAALSLKVSEKGALSVYGMGRFPITLYRGQWEKLLAMADAIRQFIVDNEGKLAKKTPESIWVRSSPASSGLPATMEPATQDSTRADSD
jgi:hypothetical protein